VADREPQSAAGAAGQRAARNTAARALGEIAGKLASLAVFIALARTVGEAELGDFVLALAWVEVAMIPIALGSERYILHEVARDRTRVHELLYNGIALKLTRAVPITVVSFALLEVLDYSSQTRQAVYILTVGVLMDSFMHTLSSIFNAFERGTLVATTIVVQRTTAAALGLAALAAGGGIVEVSVTYTIGTTTGFALGLVLMRRTVGLPAPRIARDVRARLARASRGYGIQDILGVLLAKLDAVLLSLLASAAAVGRYGTAYRLLESTFFLTIAVLGAFAAMFTYLDRDSEPSVQTVFERAVKLELALLVPCAVGFGLLAEPVVRLLFGAEFENAAVPLRLLAPAIVCLGIVTIASSLLIARGRLPLLLRVGAVAVVLNIGLNLALIPSLDDAGAATAMLITAVALAAVVLERAVAAVGGVPWRRMLAAPLAAGAAMALPLALLPWPAAALAAGLAAYAGAYVVVERAISPTDLRFLIDLARRLMPSVGVRRRAA
jgi:O-antigen/teichoic acid export membrane protein